MSVSTQVPAVGLVVGGSTVVVVAVVPAGAAVDGADVAGPEVIGEDVAGVAVGFAVTTVIVPPPQPQHMSSSVNTAVSNVPSP